VGSLSLSSQWLKHLWLTFSSNDLRVIRFLCLHLDLYPVWVKLGKCFWQWWSLWAQESLALSLTWLALSLVMKTEAECGTSGWRLQRDVLCLALYSNVRASAFLCLLSSSLCVPKKRLSRLKVQRYPWQQWKLLARNHFPVQAHAALLAWLLFNLNTRWLV